ncbi:MAG: DUF4184 family protein [Crocinitomicaceae bacterium]|nr:DUF4184 family protein [Crocinitomicaceae bacterium]
MPFTFSHPAIILPLAKINAKYISVSALVIGSMSPDFEYFIRMRLKQVHGHNLAGAFYFDLPVTIISLILFHFLVRDTLIDHLPEFLRKKYASFYQMNWFEYARKHWYVILYSAVIGILSHLFWDAFTHAPGYFVQYIPYLKEELLIFNVKIPSYDFMQLLSSGFGALIIATVILWPKDQKFSIRSYQKPVRYIFYVMLIALLTLILRGADTQSEIIATSISGGLIGMMVVPFLLKRPKLDFEVQKHKISK